MIVLPAAVVAVALATPVGASRPAGGAGLGGRCAAADRPRGPGSRRRRGARRGLRVLLVVPQVPGRPARIDARLRCLPRSRCRQRSAHAAVRLLRPAALRTRPPAGSSWSEGIVARARVRRARCRRPGPERLLAALRGPLHGHHAGRVLRRPLQDAVEPAAVLRGAVLMAGYGAAALLGATRSRLARGLVAGALLAAVAHLAVQDWRANFRYPADPAQSLRLRAHRPGLPPPVAARHRHRGASSGPVGHAREGDRGPVRTMAHSRGTCGA